MLDNSNMAMAQTFMHGRDLFDDAVRKRNVCKRMVLIEKHKPKYIGSDKNDSISPDFLASMGAIVFAGEAIHRLIVAQMRFKQKVSLIFSPSKRKKVKSEKIKQDESSKASLWEIAKFTIENAILRKKSKRKG